jgi:hypothetical protein
MMFPPLVLAYVFGLCFGLGEKQLDVPVKMVDRGGGNVGSVLGFGEDEGALEDGLVVKREALGGPLPYFRIASAMSASTTAAWSLMRLSHASRRAEWVS